MRIISLSNAASPSFWALPVQALAPWMNRVKHLVKQVAQRDSDARAHALTSVVRAASNDAVFAPPGSTTALHFTNLGSVFLNGGSEA